MDFASAGHEVTYLTRKQWTGDTPIIDGVHIKAIIGHHALYNSEGNRRITEAVHFGWGVFWHLLKNRQQYDIVHLCSFPYFSLIASRVALFRTGVILGVDWFEVWSDNYWKRYLGRVLGYIGCAVQSTCVRLTPLAFTYSELAASRLKKRGLKSEPVKLRGMHPGEPTHTPVIENPSVGQRVLWIGRLIPEKRASLVPPVIAALHQEYPLLRGLLIGAGPEADLVNETISELGVSDLVAAPGFVEREAVAEAFATSDCLLVTSQREGYGVVVLEATACGTPVVVVEAEDNAASELIVPGVNGYLVNSDNPHDIARVISQVIREGPQLRERTRTWFEDNAESLQSSEIVRQTYETMV